MLGYVMVWVYECGSPSSPLLLLPFSSLSPLPLPLSSPSPSPLISLASSLSSLFLISSSSLSSSSPPLLLPSFYPFIPSPLCFVLFSLLFISSPPFPPPSSPSPSSSLLSFPLQLLIMQTPNCLLPALCMGGTRISPKAAGRKRSSLLCGVQTIQWREGVRVCVGECRWTASECNRLAHQ